jgi:hypothetical protein
MFRLLLVLQSVQLQNETIYFYRIKYYLNHTNAKCRVKAIPLHSQKWHTVHLQWAIAGCMFKEFGFNFKQGHGIFVLSTTLRPALGPKELTSQGVKFITH